MKKLKASEITEPGWYWIYCDGSAPIGIQHRKPGKDTGYGYIKAEPPKVCRWKKKSDYQTSCGKEFFSYGDLNELGYLYCPGCGGRIELEFV